MILGVAAGSGTYEIQFPVAPRTTLQKVLGEVILYDDSAGLFTVALAYLLDTGEFRIAIPSTQLTVADLQPWIWAANDQISFNMTYEAA